MTQGATFKRADLHLHTPGEGQNFRAGTALNTDAERQAFAEAYVQRALDAGLEVIAITNHNSTACIDLIRQAAQGTDLTVFPGVEVGTDSGRDGVHLLAVFDKDVPTERVEEFLLALGLRRNCRFDAHGNPTYSDLSVPQVLDRIEEFGGLAIAPHVFSENGLLRSQEGTVRLRNFTDPRLLAVDFRRSLQDLTDWQRYVVTNQHADPNFRRPRPIACLNSSDAKSLDEIGTWYTWMKLEEPTLEALRQAFLDAESRVRLRDDAPAIPEVHLIRLQVEDGFLDSLDLNLNPALNCLIGGRGAGKSSVIQVIRHLFDLPPHPQQEEEMNELVRHVFPASAKASLDVAVGEHHYRVERVGYQAPRVYREGEGQPLEVMPAQLLPSDAFLEVYGQKEVLATAFEPGTQMKLVDRSIRQELERLEQEERALLTRLGHNQQDIIHLWRQLELAAEQRAELPRLRLELEMLEHAGIADRLETRRRYDRERFLWESAAERLEDLETALADAQQEAVLDTSFLADEQVVELPNAADLRTLRGLLEGAAARVQSHLNQAMEALRQVRRDFEERRAAWQRRYDAYETEYIELVRQLPGEGAISHDRLLELERRKSQLEQVEREARRYQTQLDELQRQRRDLLAQLDENRRQQFQHRRRQAERLSERLAPTIRVRVAHTADKEAFQEHLRTLLAGSGLRRADYERITEHPEFSLRRFLSDLEQADVNLSHLVQVYGLTETAARKFIEHLNRERRLELDAYRIPDAVTIELNVGTSELPDYRPLDHLSVGQRCTALLTIILLEGKGPLIIDQPEDDLDNRFIYDEIVQLLRRERGHRQVIVATHNANIPVAGDAELITALTASRHGGELRCQVLSAGFIDNPAVKEQVETILEGGKAAFELRRQKYGF